MTKTTRPVPEYLVERWRRGELPAGQAKAIEAELSADPTLLARLQASDEEILKQLPAEAISAEVQRRLKSAQRPAPRPLMWLAPLALAGGAAAALLLARPAADLVVPQQEPPETITAKGEARPAMLVYRKTGDGRQERVSETTSVRPGDTLQVRYVAGGGKYGVVASIDARGAVTLHLPEQPGDAAALHGDGERAVPSAFELDDTPGFERFLFVTANEPFETGIVEAILRNQRSAPPAYSVVSVTLKKETR